ncbi:hypothetical protein ILUMI_11095 [Ignelater luminosus]|uniref:Uncharacterized protein n=1 Tax=Ignelater luminosus TaxID=2038154 RepID=A0A8K0GD08_IGNLU|nr:hypothetical protein ILUMI_11095 [Ignelater luminosus]
MLNDIVQRIHDEDVRAMEERMCKIKKTQQEINKFKVAQETKREEMQRQVSIFEEEQRAAKERKRLIQKKRVSMLQGHAYNIKNKDVEIIREKSGISKVVEDFYTQLYSITILQPKSVTLENITNVGPEDIPAFTTDEINHALSQMKNGRNPSLDEISAKMLKLAGAATL